MIESDLLNIKYNSKMIDALVQLNVTAKRNLICVFNDETLAGTISDGDIRRSLIAGYDINGSIESAINTNPVFVTKQTSATEAQSLLSSRTPIIPVVDEKKIVIGYYSYKQRVDYTPIRERTITILGMGYVGLTLALIMADLGFRVKGYDINNDLILKLNNNIPPFYEDDLERLIKQNKGERLTFSTAVEESLSDVYIITVGTPLNLPSKKPNVDYIRTAAFTIGKYLSKNNLVILRSTVPIECSREIVIPVLEECSGLKCGEDFHFAFAPERTAEGVALKELRNNPQVIGAYDPISYELTARLFNEITHSVIDVGSIEAAETAKLIDNTFRDHLFAYANNMAMLTEKLGLNYHLLAKAVNYSYGRNMIPKPSPGVGGPCLSKDPYILKTVFEKYGLDTSIIDATRKVNEAGPCIVKNKLEKLLNKADKNLENVKKISLVGLAFKGDPETSDLRDSTSLWFLDQLPRNNNIYAYDPVVKKEEIANLGINPLSDIEEVFIGADAVVFLNNHKSYQKWAIKEMITEMNFPGVIIDTWFNFDPMIFKRQSGILYGGIGND